MSRTVVTFDGHRLTDDYHVSNLRTSLLPRSIATQVVGGRDGTLLTGSRLDQRTVALTLTAMSKSAAGRQGAARALAAILAVDEPRPLELSIDGGLSWMAMPRSPEDIALWFNAASFEVIFECVDPVAYGAERTVTVASGSSASFSVGGTYPASPVISVASARNPSGGTWRLALDDGSYVAVDLPSARALSIDCAARTLTVGGTVTMLQPEADWLALEPGTRTLTMAGSGTATVTYRERWL